VRTGEDRQRFVAGEGLPLGIGLGKVAFRRPWGPQSFTTEGGEWPWGGCRFCVCLRSEENGEGVGAHGLDEEGAISELVEAGVYMRSIGCARSGMRLRGERG